MMRLLFSWRGRILRTDWWFGSFVSVFLSILLSLFWIITNHDKPVESISHWIQEDAGYIVAIFIWNQVCLSIKRYHDIGWSRYYALILVIPFLGWIINTVLCGFIESDRNKS